MLNISTTPTVDNSVRTSLADYEALFIIIIIATFILNLHNAIIIITNKKLHVPVNMFILSLCIIGLIVSSVNMPLQLVYLIDNYGWKYGLGSCVVWYILDLSSCTILLLNYIIITFIRYMSIIRPKAEWASKKIQILVLALLWLLPVTLWSISLTVLFIKAPPEGLDCYLSIEIDYSITVDVFAFIVPLLCLIILNCVLIWELKKRKKIVFGQEKLKNLKNTIAVPPTPQITELNTVEQSGAIVSATETSYQPTNNDKKKVNIIQIKRKIGPINKEKKAIISLVILQLGFIVCWMPFIVNFPMDSFSITLNADWNNMVYWIAYFNLLFSPIVLITTSENYQILCKKETYFKFKMFLKLP